MGLYAERTDGPSQPDGEGRPTSAARSSAAFPAIRSATRAAVWTSWAGHSPYRLRPIPPVFSAATCLPRRRRRPRH